MTESQRIQAEGVLSSEQYDRLLLCCEDVEVDPREWHRHPMLRQYWSTVAAKRLGERIQRTRGVDERAARGMAARILGLTPKALEKRLQRLDNAA